WAVLLTQLVRFCVPVFLILSGYGLTRKYDPNGTFQSLDVKAFFQGRLGRIALPFVVLSLLFLFFRGLLPGSAGWLAGAWVYVEALAAGSADYHLYFLSIILQCYALYPI